MSKKLKTVIIIVVALALIVCGGYLFWKVDYDKVDVSGVAITPINIAGHEVMPESSVLKAPVLGKWQEKIPGFFNALEPVFGSFRYKQFEFNYVEEGGGELDLLVTAPYSLAIEIPGTNSMQWFVIVEYINESGEKTPVYVSEGQESSSEPGYLGPHAPITEKTIIKKVGEYVVSVEGALNALEQSDPFGNFSYRVYFTVKNPDPVFTGGRTELAQGDILSIKLENIPDGTIPELESALGSAVFTKGVPFMLEEGDDEEGVERYDLEGLSNWYAIAPVSNSRAVGDYNIYVRAGDFEYEAIVTVTKYDFDFQNLIIDMSVPSNAAAVSSKAIEEFREKVTPLLPLMSEERYWDGAFIMPVDLGDKWFVSTEFGEIRITNGDQSTRRSHNGIDYALPTGTHVNASGAGKVLLAEFLLNTGYTVIIDHGGGLKSIYYHMETVETEVSKLVSRGELIGTVGSTGYSTGPHLHFEMRVGEQPINPSMLFDLSAGLYSAR